MIRAGHSALVDEFGPFFDEICSEFASEGAEIGDGSSRNKDISSQMVQLMIQSEEEIFSALSLNREYSNHSQEAL